MMMLLQQHISNTNCLSFSRDKDLIVEMEMTEEWQNVRVALISLKQVWAETGCS